METPFWQGKDVFLVVLLEKKKLQLPNMSITVTQLGEEFQDDINGQDRSEFGTTLDGYQIAINSVKQRRTDQLKAFLEVQANRDNRQLPKESSIGMLIRHQDGTKSAFDARDVTLGLWAFNIEGRKARNSLDCPFKAKYWDR